MAVVTLIAFSSAASSNARAGVVVVVSARSPVSKLTAAQTAQIFLGKSSTFPGGSHAIPLDQDEGSDVRNEFYAKVIGKSPTQLNAYWSRIIFSGDGQPPEVVSGNTAVRKAVADNPEAVGYIDERAVDSSVRIVLTPSE